MRSKILSYFGKTLSVYRTNSSGTTTHDKTKFLPYESEKILARSIRHFQRWSDDNLSTWCKGNIWWYDRILSHNTLRVHDMRAVHPWRNMADDEASINIKKLKVCSWLFWVASQKWLILTLVWSISQKICHTMIFTKRGFVGRNVRLPSSSLSMQNKFVLTCQFMLKILLHKRLLSWRRSLRTVVFQLKATRVSCKKD